MVFSGRSQRVRRSPAGAVRWGGGRKERSTQW
ncbi:hypothetical protein GBAR_LOCUS31484 [Geodia barretti]|uniref:Uncharacterized protein n=1 Tax=Geodia barretti TaxID=519541 RepID=A0AA35XN39_GEOBA|nr:hypothetical protein GBAR_LOCUS31484 [Geodia barretti]